MSDDKPPERPTAQLPKEEIQAGLLKSLEKAVTSGFAEMRERLEAQDATLDTVVKEGKRTTQRLTDLETRVGDVENRIGRTSTRVREQSEHDLTQDAELAKERAAREALAAEVAALKSESAVQTAILTRLDKLTSHPTAKLVAYAVFVAVAGWLASKGIRLPGTP